MISALLLLTAAATTPQQATVAYAEAAYIGGRCVVWMNDLDRAIFERDMDAISPRLRVSFNEGVADGKREGIAFDVCAKLLNDAATKIRKL